MTQEEIEKLKKGQFVQSTIGIKPIYEITNISDGKVFLLRTKHNGRGKLVNLKMSPPLKNMRDFDLVK